MFMGTLIQRVSIGKGLCFDTLQLRLLLGTWELKEAVTKKHFSVVCVQVTFVFNAGVSLGLQERRSWPKILRRWSCFCAVVGEEPPREERVQSCPCVQHLPLAWPEVTFSSVCVCFWGILSIPSLKCPDLLLSVGGEADSGFAPCGTKASKQNTSANCESWNCLWTWPSKSEPQKSLSTFGDPCAGYHGDENNIWNSSLVCCASAAGMGKQLIMTITEIMPKPYTRTVWSVGFLIRHIKLLLSFLSPAGNKIWKESSCSIFNVPVQSESLPIELPFRESPCQRRKD